MYLKLTSSFVSFCLCMVTVLTWWNPQICCYSVCWIRCDPGLDQRVFNTLTASQVATIWVEDNENANGIWLASRH
ncbi:uncharacterized protein LOC111397275 isoform X2 [Olea europaea var. sylvestris]|uniref:uncharacterized protein LOC111397275 isoform X2 n=1 Tax=Olea europaea var. sylvestris TaxID=158386 RepID=UPI000C1CE495|nr:uncharacterized protein LOC111397275 isoform X2 [Olea europaea var. sylvestris]